MCNTRGHALGGPDDGWGWLFRRATFADPGLETVFWDWHTRLVLVDTDRRYYAGAAIVLAVAGGVVIRDGVSLSALAVCAAGLAMTVGLAMAVGAHPGRYIRHREAAVGCCRLALTVIAAWIGSAHLPARTDTFFGVLATKMAARGPLAAMVSGWAGLQLRPHAELAVQTASLVVAVPFSAGMCAACLGSPAQVAVIQRAAAAIDTVGVGLINALDHAHPGVIERLTAPAGDPCALVSIFALIWLGWAGPLAASRAMARRSRRLFLRKHFPGGWPVGVAAKPLAWGALATAIMAFNGLLAVELSWRTLKWIVHAEPAS
ncbi:unnamed protein product [Ostreobium quekettii]|uniref:Uncharacterized protein n=1 Tax=Ostreobium quekettii TaxID=121088 RepID=A0A8S1JB43_9CHLO|nr:unnamed protein product [Ostreobium quekettii]